MLQSLFIAGGCQIVCFTSGMGNPMGNALAPVIIITGNHNTAKMTDIIDYDTSASLRGEKTLQEVADELFALMIEVASGRPTLSELNGADVMLLDQYMMGC